MRQLRLVGLAEDGASLLLETPTGEAFRLPLDERVRAACRGDLTRLGQIEIELDNPLRPREIQTRVRAGESAEEVAASAGMPVDRVLRFAYPVLQERARVVAQARATQIHPKRPHTLAELVDERLVGRGTDAATLRWDAWRRDDGLWVVRLTWRHAAEHSASWVFQLARRTLQPDDPAAEQLSAEEFHARTITAVTPLAVAARVSGRSHPEPARPGDRPARGVEARAGRTGRPDPAGSGADPGGRWAAGRARAADPAAGSAGATDQPRPDQPRTDRAEADRAGADRPGPGQPGAEQAGAERPEPEQAGADRTGGGQAGADPSAVGAERGAVAAGAPGVSAAAAQGDRTRGASERAAGGAERGAGGASRAAGGATAAAESDSTTGGSERSERGNERTGSAPGQAGAAGDRTKGRSAPSAGGRNRRRSVAGTDAGDGPHQHRIAAGGESDLRAETDEERARRASVPSWDDILLGVRRRH